MIHRVTLNRLSCDKTRSKLNPDQEAYSTSLLTEEISAALPGSSRTQRHNSKHNLFANIN